MKFWPYAAATLIAAETAAIACSCINSDDPAELREFAADAATDAVAVVEVETLVTWEQSGGAGDRMRVVSALAGAAPKEFRVERGEFPSSASCDLLFRQGERDVVILYPAEQAAGSDPTYRISGLCYAHLLDKPVFRDEVVRLMAERAAAGERG